MKHTSERHSLEVQNHLVAQVIEYVAQRLHGLRELPETSFHRSSIFVVGLFLVQLFDLNIQVLQKQAMLLSLRGELHC